MMKSADRTEARNIINEIAKESNIKIDAKVATYHKLSTILKCDVHWKLINQIACLAAMGNSITDTYEFCQKNMDTCEEEMKIAKKNAHMSKTAQSDMCSAIDVFLQDNILQEANTEYGVSSSEEGKTSPTLDCKIKNENVTYRDLEKLIKREILSQLMGVWASLRINLCCNIHHQCIQGLEHDMPQAPTVGIDRVLLWCPCVSQPYSRRPGPRTRNSLLNGMRARRNLGVEISQGRWIRRRHDHLHADERAF